MSGPMDVLWFRLPRQPGDPEDAIGRIAKGHLVAILNRGDQWQVAYVIAKGSYKELHDAGLTAFRRDVAEAALRSDQPLSPPAFLCLPILRDVPPRIVGFGIWPVHLAPELCQPSVPRRPEAPPVGAARETSRR